ncbi:MAG: hypothetical protein AB7G09_26515, partial [Pseudonocardia sp.]
RHLLHAARDTLADGQQPEQLLVPRGGPAGRAQLGQQRLGKLVARASGSGVTPFSVVEQLFDSMFVGAPQRPFGATPTSTAISHWLVPT